MNQCHKCQRPALHASEGKSICIDCLTNEIIPQLKHVGRRAVAQFRAQHGMTAQSATTGKYATGPRCYQSSPLPAQRPRAHRMEHRN
jgi:hypothetical protein